MDRLTEMKEYILPKWNERFREDITKIQTDFNRHQNEIILKFRSHIDDNLISKLNGYPSLEEKESEFYLMISYLHSELLSRGYEYEISLCNELFFADKNMITAYWYPEFLYQYIGDEEVFLQKELQRKFIRLKKYEIELLRQDLFSSYWDVAKKYFKELTGGISQKEKLKIYYGEHMGELTELL